MLTVDHRSMITQCLTDARRALDTLKAAVSPDRPTFEAQVAAAVTTRRQATPSHIRVSDDDLRRAAIGDVQRASVLAVREARALAGDQVQGLRPLLATITKAARSRSMPVPVGSETDQLRQELRAARLTQRYSARPLAAQLAALADAEARCDGLEAAVLDQLIGDAFADAPPVPAIQIEALPDHERPSARARRDWFTQYEAVQSARLVDSERHQLDAWTQDLDAIEATYRRASDVAAAVAQVGAVAPVAVVAA